MNTTPYTDDQILEAFEKAMDATTTRDQIFVREIEDRKLYREAQRGARLQIGKKFLELLGKPQQEPDPYAELKAARDAGKVIQIRSDEEPATWGDIENPVFGAAPDEYRIKPEPDTKEMWERIKELSEESKTQTKAEPWTPKPGDVVQLKSGGPRMTCVCVREKDSAFKCAWFTEGGTILTDYFPLACLKQA